MQNRFDEFYFLSYAEQRAAMAVYRKFHINRFELNLLAALYAFLQIKGRRAVAINVLFDWLGYHRQQKYNSRGYLQGLRDKGCVHCLNYNRQPNQKGNSYCITPFGGRILEYFYSQVEAIDQANKGRKKNPGLSDKIIPSDRISDLLPQYYLFSKGRDN